MSRIHNARRHVQQEAFRHSAGFTLIELMVVVALLVLIASMTVAAINVNTNNDKVRAGSRQVQSYLAGARDRAIYSKAPRGVRFLLDPMNPRTVSSMVFVAPTDPWSQGTIQFERLDLDNDNMPDYPDSDAINGGPRVVRGFDNDSDPRSTNPTDWYNLHQQKLLDVGSRIRIPADNGKWYTVQSVSQLTSTSPRLRLTEVYQGSQGGLTPQTDVAAFNQGSGPLTYLLELPPSVLPNQDPVLMPKGAVIHLDRCSNSFEQTNASTAAAGRGNKLPDFWKRSPSTATPIDTSGFDYKSTMDVMFSPRGVVIGTAAQKGIIHFYIADQKDADRDQQYWSSPPSYPTSSAPEFGPWTSNTSDPSYERGDKVILSLFTRTGAVSTHHVHPTDTFKYAETGEVAGK